MTRTPILVAGATGTNGSELLRQLVAADVPVRALVRDPASAVERVPDSVTLAQGDFGEPDTLRAALEGIERAYIVAPIHRDALQWFGNFFVAARDAGVSQVVKFSGYGASVDSPSRIIRQHWESDRLLAESGLTYTILRPNSFYQNLFWQAQSIREAGHFYLAAGDAAQSMVDVRDLAAATVRILTESGHENVIYELTGPESLDYHDVARQLSQATGRGVTYVAVAPEAVREAMCASGLPAWNAQALAEIQALFASGLYAPVEADLASILGRQPGSFAAFAADYAEVFRP